MQPKGGIQMKKQPNQAPEPTPLRVTPAAYAPVAPRSVAAHLFRSPLKVYFFMQHQRGWQRPETKFSEG